MWCRDSSRGTGSFPGANERLIPRRGTRFPRLPCPCPGQAQPPRPVAASCRLSRGRPGGASPGLHLKGCALIAAGLPPLLAFPDEIGWPAPSPTAGTPQRASPSAAGLQLPAPPGVHPAPLRVGTRTLHALARPSRAGVRMDRATSSLTFLRPRQDSISPVKTERPAVGCATEAM